jgi:Bacterial Ig-like domain
VNVRVSVASSGTETIIEADGDSFGTPSISADGRYVAFGSAASNLVANDTNRLVDIFVHERDPGTTQPDDCIAPTATRAAPTGETVSPGANAEATFSEAMDPNTLTIGTFTLTKQGSTSPVAAHVSYDAANKKAILDPDSPL